MLLNYAALDADGASVAASPYGGDGFMLGRDEMGQFWVNYLRDSADAKNPLASPALADLGALPSAFLTIAECDVLADQNLAFARRLTAAGVATTARVYRGATHSFLEAVSISSLAAQALQDGADWLRATLG
jgi:acetyl esterase